MGNTTLFLVTLATDKHLNHVYTITEKKKQAEEWINKMTYIENRKHFKMWCELKGVTSDPENDGFNESWCQYYDSCISTADPKYVMSKVSYKPANIATLFRIYNKCVPIGCSYDEDIEIAAALKTMGELDDDCCADDTTKLNENVNKA